MKRAILQRFLRHILPFEHRLLIALRVFDWKRVIEFGYFFSETLERIFVKSSRFQILFAALFRKPQTYTDTTPLERQSSSKGQILDVN